MTGTAAAVTAVEAEQAAAGAPPPAPRAVLRAALALALASAVALGLSRFAYALLLPPMRADLGWSYFTAGAMNTVNAAGYLAGALLAPRLLHRLDARRFVILGGLAAAVLMALHGLVRSDAALYGLRWACGTASAASFVGGGVLAARLAGRAPSRSGLVLGVYYGVPSVPGLNVQASGLASGDFGVIGEGWFAQPNLG